MTNATIAGAVNVKTAAGNASISSTTGLRHQDPPVGWFPPGLDQMVLAGTPTQMLAALINAGLNPSTVLLATQIVEANQLTRNLLDNVNKLRELKAGIQQRVSDLEAVATWFKQCTTGGGDGKEKSLEIDKLNFAEFFSDNPGLAGRLGISKGELSTMMKDYADACSKTPAGKEPPTFQQACHSHFDKLKAKMQQLFVAQTFSLEDGQVKITLGDPIAMDVTALKSAVDRQNQDQGAIDTQTSLINLRLQEAMQQKERLVTLSTNMTAAIGRAQKAITDNIR